MNENVNIPQHIAIIMDGNGRWAKNRGLPRLAGHREGAKAVQRAVKAACEIGINALTLYAFSSENWQRPQDEVTGLMGLLRHYIRSELAELSRKGVRLRFIGDRGRLDENLLADINSAEQITASNDRLLLTIALSYGARADITSALKKIAHEVEDGKISPNDITENMIARHLSTDGLPDPDLVIRTSGEQRISNFLLWECAYAEFLFLDVKWPDFTENDMRQAVRIYQSRDRRFGGLKTASGAA